jgi:hypothetical protein
MFAPLRLTVLAVVLLAAGTASAQEKFAVKKIKKESPKELPADIQALLHNEAIAFTTKDGQPIAEIWLAREIKTGGKGPKGKKDLDYPDLPTSAIVGAVQFAKTWTDYRKQSIKPGVYTLRVASQPQDGDHMGTAPYPNFLVLLSPKYDTKADLLEFKSLAERSAASIGRTHPCVLLLFPGDKAGAEPKLMPQPNNHLTLTVRDTVTVDGRAGDTLGIALTLVGHAAD